MVTKQQQLEWLATMWDTWPGINFNAVRMSSQIAGSYNYGMGYHTITREEWQQERDKMSKTPDVTISNQTSATIASTQTGDFEMTITAPDNSWHERGELPPVGATAEKKCKSATIWTEIKIVAAGNQLVIFGYPSGEEAFGEWSDYDFRPLRTEREKAIDEMADLIAKSVFGSAKCQAERLYDSGYRKEKSK